MPDREYFCLRAYCPSLWKNACSPERKGKPVKSRRGETFRKWKEQLQVLGYEIEHRELVAADYGAPTIRKRFFLIARCDGKKIIWPERTHAPKDSEEVKNTLSNGNFFDYSRANEY